MAEADTAAAAPSEMAPAPETEADSPGQLSGSSVPQAAVWQLDFCSRPVLDERGKKQWELIICDETREFEFVQFFSNNQINSTKLAAVLRELIEQPGAKKPERVKFFRGQMQTIITRALIDLDIKPIPSRRCFTLLSWLRERVESTYPQMEGYSTKVAGPLAPEVGAPRELPDALRGEAWQFVQLPLNTLQEELCLTQEGKIFGATFDLKAIGVDLPEDTMIPGIAVYSRRAEAVAAWTSGVELSAVVADAERACLLLEAGVADRYQYGRYRRTPESTAEARAWEEAKTTVRGLHFLVIQADEDAEESSGLWFLQEQSSVPV